MSNPDPSKELKKSITHWEKALVNFKDQSKRLHALGTDYLPLWLGASKEDCILWIEEEIRLLKNNLTDYADHICTDCNHDASLHNNAAHCQGENCTCKAFN